VLLCALTGCIRKERPAPRGILSEDKMEKILTDMHLADAVLNQNFWEKGGSDSITWRAKSFRKLVLEKYHISKQTFTKSLDYYIANTEELDLMYEKMIGDLNKAENRVQHDTASWKREKAVTKAPSLAPAGSRVHPISGAGPQHSSPLSKITQKFSPGAGKNQPPSPGAKPYLHALPR